MTVFRSLVDVLRSPLTLPSFPVIMIPSLVIGLLSTVGCATGEDVGEAPTSADEPAVRLEKVGRIGCSDCDGPEQLDVFALAVDPGGRVWTLDHYEPIVRVFGRDGGILGGFGQRGEGPGEFTGAGADAFFPGLAIYPREGGRAWVHRRAPAGLMEFDVDTGHVGDTPFAWPASRIPRSVTYDARARRAFVTALALPRADVAAADRVAIYRLDILSREREVRQDGEAHQGAMAHQEGETQQGGRVHEDGEVRVEVVEIDIDPALVPRREDDPAAPSRAFPIAVAPDGSLVLGDPLRYEIVRVGADGSVLSRFGRDVARPPKGPERLRRERERAARFGRPPAEVSEELPHFGADAFDFDDAGRLWVGTNRRVDGGGIFDLFASDGAFLGEVRIPDPLQDDGLTSFEVVDGHLVAAVVGPGGNDRIDVWRIEEE